MPISMNWNGPASIPKRIVPEIPHDDEKPEPIMLRIDGQDVDHSAHNLGRMLATLKGPKQAAAFMARYRELTPYADANVAYACKRMIGDRGAQILELTGVAASAIADGGIPGLDR